MTSQAPEGITVRDEVLNDQPIHRVSVPGEGTFVLERYPHAKRLLEVLVGQVTLVRSGVTSTLVASDDRVARATIMSNMAPQLKIGEEGAQFDIAYEGKPSDVPTECVLTPVTGE